MKCSVLQQTQIFFSHTHKPGRRWVWMWVDREWARVSIRSQRWSRVYLHNGWRRYAYTQEMRWDTEAKSHISSPLCPPNQQHVCTCACVCVSPVERTAQRREELAGSIWRRFSRLQINMISWHLITLPITVNHNQPEGLHTHTCAHTLAHAWTRVRPAAEADLESSSNLEKRKTF